MHKLETFKTTLKDAGEKIATGHCSCGWYTETTFVKEVVSSHKKHKEDCKDQKLKETK